MGIEGIDFNCFITKQKFSNLKSYLEWLIYKYEKNYGKLENSTLAEVLEILEDLNLLKYKKSDIIDEFKSLELKEFNDKMIKSLFKGIPPKYLAVSIKETKF